MILQIIQAYLKISRNNDVMHDVICKMTNELIKLKYGSPVNAINELGTIDDIRNVFCDFQKYLYQVKKDIKDAV